MKKILVPVDFSLCSLDAFIYAREFARRLGATIKVIYVDTSPNTATEPFLLRPGKSREASLMERLKEFTSIEVGKNAGKVKYGPITHEVSRQEHVIQYLLQIIRAQAFDLVIMGTSGAGNQVDVFIGSVSTTMARQAGCPVLLIPPGVQYQEIDRIIYATNYESAEELMIREVAALGRLLRAEMHFVHVDEWDKYEAVEKALFEGIFKDGDPDYIFNMINIEENKPVMDGLLDYVKDQKMDLLVLVNRQQAYLDDYFRVSLTQQMALEIKIPMMVMHPDRPNFLKN